MRCARCGTVPDAVWRWCPDCGTELVADIAVDLRAAEELYVVEWTAEPAPGRPVGPSMATAGAGS